jgi:hypothetical protein
VYPHISGGKIWLPFTVETEDGMHACGMYELLPDDPKYQETKQCLEALRGEWSRSFFPEEKSWLRLIASPRPTFWTPGSFHHPR